jgi:DNA-binding MarR family transcriptional regulator
MAPSGPGMAEQARRRRRKATELKESLRALSIQLSLLNLQVGAHLDLNYIDLHCLDLINRVGPLSPTALARRAGIHPATMTGVLDRLQRAGWIVRERDPEATDRRAVTIRAVRDRNSELFTLYSGMNESMDDIFDSYSEEELTLIADFLRRTIDAGQAATATLAGT